MIPQSVLTRGWISDYSLLAESEVSRAMKTTILILAGLVVLGWAVASSAQAETVTCEIRSVNGDTLILVGCDPKRLREFQPGKKVKVKQERDN